jgi:molecular chaperone HscB
VVAEAAPEPILDMKLTDDDFTLFGLPVRYAIDSARLDESRRVLQAQVHPDRHVAAGAGAQRMALQWAARVNEAYRRLKDPLERAAYLCELRGSPVAAESNTAMPPAFLIEQMGWREALEDAADAAAIEALDRQAQAREQSLFAEVRTLLDEAGDAEAATQRVRALMFVARFRADLERRLDMAT